MGVDFPSHAVSLANTGLRIRILVTFLQSCPGRQLRVHGLLSKRCITAEFNLKNYYGPL